MIECIDGFYVMYGDPFVTIGNVLFPAGVLSCSADLKKEICSYRKIFQKDDPSSQDMDEYSRLILSVCSEICSATARHFDVDVIYDKEFLFAQTLCGTLVACQMYSVRKGLQFLLDVSALNFAFLEVNFDSCSGIGACSHDLAAKYYLNMLSRLYMIGDPIELQKMFENRRSTFKRICNDLVVRKGMQSCIDTYFLMARYDFMLNEFNNEFEYVPHAGARIIDRRTLAPATHPDMGISYAEISSFSASYMEHTMIHIFPYVSTYAKNGSKITKNGYEAQQPKKSHLPLWLSLIAAAIILIALLTR